MAGGRLATAAGIAEGRIMRGESSVTRVTDSEATQQEQSGLPKALRERAGRDLSSYSRAYGRRAAKLLLQVQDLVQEAIADFAERFYDELVQREETATVLSRLDASELEHLKAKQQQHLAGLLSPALTVGEHFERARRVGRVHEMVGVELPSLLEAYHQYQRQILALVPRCGLNSVQQELLGKVLMQRLMLDMEAQSVSHHEVDIETTAVVSELDKVILNAATLTDVLQGGTAVLAGLDGIVACLISRPDSQGQLQVEAVAGAAGREYVESMQAGEIPLIQTEAQLHGSQGPTGQAWRSARVIVCDSYRRDPSLGPWRETGIRLGFRSSASVPLLDEAGQPFATLILYSRWPGFFGTVQRRSMLSYTQQALAQAVLRFQRGTAIPLRLRQAQQQRLRAGAVTMHYQPIIDLRSGALRCVEALARLQGEDGKLISPAVFLPAFGNADLLQLFRLGLAQACRDANFWSGHGLDPAVSVNLPAEALTQDAYRDAVFETLSREGVPLERIQLEVLETRDPVDTEWRDARIAELRKAGIRIVQDDLGSGHSSLLRMDRIAFDAVKIDQGLVRSAAEDAKRALEFIFHLTRLVRGFGIPVTVEGLEDRALIEAVAILGADHGQGYGIARPMPASELPQWAARFRYDIDTKLPRTSLGALAGYLLWDQQRDVLNQWPDLVEYLSEYPSLVHRYIDHHGLNGSELHGLLEENRRVCAYGSTYPDFQRTRAELIALLARAYANERSAGPS
jgi:EAL domain-containing protein (putative c-di-GMP-specific phosphodiesterase class I)